VRSGAQRWPVRGVTPATDDGANHLTGVVAAELGAARRRTLGLLEPVPEPLLVRQHSELLSPMVWDLAHIANYEDLWLLRELGADGVGEAYDGLYDAFLHPRPEGYDGQAGEWPPAAWRAAPPLECMVPGGTYVIGTSTDPWAYDNERPAHEVELAPYAIDGAPVTNAAWAAFMASGGYDEPRHWNPVGWAWRQDAQVEGPLGWATDGAGGWLRNRFGLAEAVPDDEPVQHVCWFEADAFARWAGRRLPTEMEWEVAATCDPADGTKRRHPWGDEPWRSGLANLGQERLGPDPVGAHPEGRSAMGCFAMEGDVWEWTSSGFEAWAGTVPFPYREYSEVFYGGDYKVLRGGSWATSALASRGTFRNWDHPIRRHVFAGLRTARDA